MCILKESGKMSNRSEIKCIHSQLRKAIIVALALTLGGFGVLVPASPASAQPGSRLCGYYVSWTETQTKTVASRFFGQKPRRVTTKIPRLTAFAIEIPKGSSRVQTDICNAAQHRVRSLKRLSNHRKHGKLISFRRAECEDIADATFFDRGDPCLWMSRATTIVEAGDRSVAIIDHRGISFDSSSKGGNLT